FCLTGPQHLQNLDIGVVRPRQLLLCPPACQEFRRVKQKGDIGIGQAVPQKLLEWLTGTYNTMRIKKHIEAGEIERLVELSGDAACIGAPVADEKASLLPKQAESFE